MSLLSPLPGVLFLLGIWSVSCHNVGRRTQEYPASDKAVVGKTRYIDLSHAFNNETALWPGRKITFFTEFEGHDENGIWIASHGFCTSEHTSTHMDAPYHFNENGRQLHEVPFEDLLDIPGVMIDIYQKVHKYKDGKLSVVENYALTRDDVLEWEATNGKIPQGSVVLLRTGWDTRWGNAKQFRGEPTSKSSKSDKYSNSINASDESTERADNEVEDNKAHADMHSTTNPDLYDPSQAYLALKLNFPGFDSTAAKFLAEERAIRGVGVDVISIDPGNQNKFSPSHRIFAARNIYMMEMVANLHLLPPRGFNLWMMPFKIDRGTGAPTRIVAKLTEEDNKTKYRSRSERED